MVVTDATTVAELDEALAHMAHEFRRTAEHSCRREVLETYINGLLEKRRALTS